MAQWATNALPGTRELRPGWKATTLHIATFTGERADAEEEDSADDSPPPVLAGQHPGPMHHWAGSDGQAGG